MGTKGLISRTPSVKGFLFQAGEEAGTFVDLLASPYSQDLKHRADWLAANVIPLPDLEFENLVRARIRDWESEFEADIGPVR